MNKRELDPGIPEEGGGGNKKDGPQRESKERIKWQVGDFADFYANGNLITGYRIRVLGVKGDPDTAVMHIPGEVGEYTVKIDNLLPPEQTTQTTIETKQEPKRRFGKGEQVTVEMLYDELMALKTVTTGGGEVLPPDRVRRQMQVIYEGRAPISKLTNGGNLMLRNRLRRIMEREGKKILE